MFGKSRFMDQDYTSELRKIKSLSIVTTLQKRIDLKALELIQAYVTAINWEPFDDLGIDSNAWAYVNGKGYNPKLVFCHPDIVLAHPTTSLYYRGLTGLSVKAAKDYIGAIENLESGSLRARFPASKASTMARVYNSYISAIINGSLDWSIEDGLRTIVATMGITIDGSMRNKVGEIAEDRVRSLIFEWIIRQRLLIVPSLEEALLLTEPPIECTLANDIVMRFSSEPDISFFKKIGSSEDLIAIIEIKGGIDPAGALERYGAATKSFQHALATSSRCKNFFLSAVFTPELNRRIQNDRLVEKSFNLIEVIEDPLSRDQFFKEVFHYTLRMV
jgi:hypothetical protein